MRKKSAQGNHPRAIACEILSSVEQSGGRASRELRIRGGALKDERDRRLATELVYGTLRHLSELDHHLEQLSGRSLEQIQVSLLPFLRIGLYQILHLDRIPHSAAVDESVRLASRAAGPRGAGFVNAVLRKAADRRDGLQLPPETGNPAADLALRFSVPQWMVSRWLERLGQNETRSLLRALSEPSTLSIWVNPLKGTPESLTRELSEGGIEVKRSSLVPGSLTVLRGNPSRSLLFKEGKAYLQDEASQAIPWLLPLSPGEMVGDLCAAPGGKSFPLACRLGSHGRVVAVDKSLARLKILCANRDRLGITQVLPMAADLEQFDSFSRGFPAVLLDAPCTGTGTLGRHPEIRWRRRPEDLTSLVLRQKRLLDTAAVLVNPGGHLLYSVCSLEREEGEEQVGGFLKRHDEFEPVNLHSCSPAALRSGLTEEGYFRTWPHLHGMDGFFAALLQKCR